MSTGSVSDGFEANPTHVPFEGMRWVPGGTFAMGSEDFYPEERPVHRASVDGFWIDEHPITAAEFRRDHEDDEHLPPTKAPRRCSARGGGYPRTRSSPRVRARARDEEVGGCPRPGGVGARTCGEIGAGACVGRLLDGVCAGS